MWARTVAFQNPKKVSQKREDPKNHVFWLVYRFLSCFLTPFCHLCQKQLKKAKTAHFRSKVRKFAPELSGSYRTVQKHIKVVKKREKTRFGFFKGICKNYGPGPHSGFGFSTF